jgi:hypothetical protein
VVLLSHVDEDEAVHLHLLLEGVAGLQEVPPQREKDDLTINATVL